MSGQSIGSIIGGVIGVALTPFTGGASLLVTSALMAAGGLIGGLLDPPKVPNQQGPRLNDLSQQTSTYGAFIPRIYGTVALFGNVFWLENNKLKEVAHKTKQGGKGGPPESSQTTYKYYATFAVGLCEGPIFGISRIWISGKLWYNAGTVHESTLNVSSERAGTFDVFVGSEAQLPPPRMEADVGIGNCPAMRGLAYIVFNDLDVGPYGNSLAGVQVKVEVIKTGLSGYVHYLKSSSDDNTNSYGLASDGGKYVYVGRDGSIATYDVSNKAKPKSLGAVLFPKLFFRLKYYKGWLFACTEIGETLEAFKIDSDHRPLHQWSIATGQFPFGIDVADDMLALVIGGFVNNLVLYDIKDPLLPVVLSTTVIGGKPYSVKKLGNYIYIVKDTSDTFVIYDITNPLLPVLKSTTGSIGGFYDIDAVPGYVFINTFNGIKIFNVTNPLAPSLINTITASAINGIFIRGGYLYINATSITPGAARIRVYDIRDPGSAFEVSNAPGGLSVGSSKPAAILSIKNYIFVAEHASSIDQRDLRVYFYSPRVVTALPSLSSIVNDECLKSNLLSSGDIDSFQLTQSVRGYRIGAVGAIRNAIEPLQGAWPFDVIQDGYKIKFVKRGASSVATITSDKLDARGEGQSSGVQITKIREMDSILPAKVNIKYLDYFREYDTGEQYYERTNTNAINLTDLELPIVLTSGEAAGKAQGLCYLYWLERYDVTFSLPPEYNHLQPADVVVLTAPGQTYNLRIKQINYTSDGRLEIMAKYNAPAIYTPTETGEEGGQPVDTLEEFGDTIFQLLDIPLVDDALDTPGFPVAMTGNLPGWPGGILSRSDDGGATYTQLQGFSAPGTVMGQATNTIAANAGVLLDKASILNIVLDQGTLASITELQMLNGGNHFAYGADGRWEIIASQNCILQPDGSYNLSDMLRGRFGTEQYTGTHAVGDKIVLLVSADMAFVPANPSMIGLERDYKGIVTGQTLADVQAQNFIYRAINLKCLNPVHIRASINPVTGDVTISWVRRGRINNQWQDLIDVPIGETGESYDVDIFSDNTFSALKRTLTSNAQSVVYSSANLISDFGGSVGDLYYTKTKLSLHCTGIDNSTTFTDTSFSPKSVTAVGNAKVTTPPLDPFGLNNGVAIFDGSGDYLTVPDSIDLRLGGSDFTIESFVKFNGFTADNTNNAHVAIISKDASGGGNVNREYAFLVSGTTTSLTGLRFEAWSSGVPTVVLASHSFSLGVWYHLAAVRSGNLLYLFVNGVLLNPGGSALSITLQGTTTPVKIGAIEFDATFKYYFNGLIRDLRVTKFARYISTFTPSIIPYFDFQGTADLNMKIYQLSSTVGRGYPAKATITI